MNALYVKYSYTLEISSVIHWETQLWPDFGVLADLSSNSSKFSCCLFLCVRVQVTLKTSVKSNFINKMNKIILFLKRLYKNEIKLNDKY